MVVLLDARRSARAVYGWTLYLVFRAMGMLFGAGAKWRLRRAYRRLCENYHERGDKEIDIVGFSRGSALALTFANVIEHYGVRRPSDRISLGLWRHKYLGWVWRHHGDEAREDPRIRFLGIWDAVGSFGIPVRLLGIDFQQINIGLNLELSERVDTCCHALALDETRRTFRPTRVDGALEVWFRGAHSNVGGGFPNRGLSDIALAWMFGQARQCGMRLDEEGTEPLVTDLSNEREFRIGRVPQFQGTRRELLSGDFVHWTAFERSPLPSDYREGLSLLAPIPDGTERYD